MAQTFLDDHVLRSAALVQGSFGDVVASPYARSRIPFAMIRAFGEIRTCFERGEAPILDAARIHSVLIGPISAGLARDRTSAVEDLDHTQAHSELNTFVQPFLFDLGNPNCERDGNGQPILRVGSLRLQSMFPSRAFFHPVAVRVSRDLVHDLIGAKAPRNAPDIDAEIMAHHWMIDIPLGAMSMQKHHVRALFVTPRQDGLLAHHAVLKPMQGSETVTLITWTADKNGTIDYVHAASNEEGFDANLAVEELTDFFSLAIAYRMTAPKDRATEVKRIDPNALIKDRNWRQKAKKFSMFRVTDLEPPPDRFGRNGPRVSQAGGWKLGWSVTVRGHFRLQACGEKFSQRRLTWIDPHVKGPTDAPRKMPIEVLR